MIGLRHYLRNQNGAAATEFAFIAPVFILLFIGVVDFGFYLNSKMNVQNISRSLAEYVAESENDGSVDALLGDLMSRTGETGLSAEATFECECADAVVEACPLYCADEGDFERRFVKVDVTGDYQPFLPYPGIADGVTISKSSRARVD